MPLSDYESRMLAQIEVTLCERDPGFVSRFRDDVGRQARIGAVPGKALCVAGIVAGFPLLSVFGYVMTWVGAVHVVTWPVIARAKRLFVKIYLWGQPPRTR
jgi:Protein of unknown function (DUF3040)